MKLKINNELKIRDYSEPLQSQRETTSYGERLQYALSFDYEALNSTQNILTYENQLIRSWRAMALSPYIDFAVNDILNEMLASDDEEVYPIELDLTNTSYSDNIRKKIHDEFLNVQKLLQFNKKSYSLLKDWYIDGKQYFFVELSNNKKSISKITQLDPIRTKRIVNPEGIISYVYQDIDLSQTLFEIPEEQMVELTSGLMDEKHQVWISYLNKAMVPLNQVTSIEDAIVIYRLSRAPERRVFYVDVGELSKTKAEQYMREIINNYRNKMEYDSTTGTIKEKVKHMSLLDDVWLPRRGGNGTSVDTLSGGQNLGQIEDIEYFLKKLFRSLNIPFSRWGGEDSAANVIGRTTEISRDEVKYNKFISRLRQQYNTLFYILLKIQLELKSIVTSEELNDERDNIIFKWNTENMFSTFKNFDLLSERADMLGKFMPYVGQLVSLDWIRHQILGQTDNDIQEIEDQIKKEKPKMKELNINQDEVDDERQ